MTASKKAVKNPPAKKKTAKKEIASQLLIEAAEQIALEEEKIAEKWDRIFEKKLGQIILFKTVKDKKQKVYGWDAEDGLFLRGMKYKNEIFAENIGWPDMETAISNGDDPAGEAKLKFKKAKFTTREELLVFNAKNCLVFSQTAANEQLAQKFNSLLGDDFMLQNKHEDLVNKHGEHHKKVESNLDQIDKLQVEIIKTLKSLKA